MKWYWILLIVLSIVVTSVVIYRVRKYNNPPKPNANTPVTTPNNSGTQNSPTNNSGIPPGR